MVLAANGPANHRWKKFRFRSAVLPRGTHRFAGRNPDWDDNIALLIKNWKLPGTDARVWRIPFRGKYESQRACPAVTQDNRGQSEEPQAGRRPSRTERGSAFAARLASGLQNSVPVGKSDNSPLLLAMGASRANVKSPGRATERSIECFCRPWRDFSDPHGHPKPTMNRGAISFALPGF